MKNLETLSNEEIREINGGNFLKDFLDYVVNNVRDKMRDAGFL